jgi:hypothetical protein
VRIFEPMWYMNECDISTESTWSFWNPDIPIADSVQMAPIVSSLRPYGRHVRTWRKCVPKSTLAPSNLSNVDQRRGKNREEVTTFQARWLEPFQCHCGFDVHINTFVSHEHTHTHVPYTCTHGCTWACAAIWKLKYSCTYYFASPHF